MTYTNAFLPFSTGTSANVVSDSSYSGSSVRTTGVVAGPADAALANKTWRQSSSVAAMIGQFTADYGTGNVLDDGNIANLEAQYKAALTGYFSGQYLPLTGGTLTGNVVAEQSISLATGSADGAGSWAALNFGDIVSGAYRQEYNISMAAGADGSRPLTIGRYSGGAFIDNPITIQTNGRVGLAHDPVASLDAVTKQYVDAAVAAGGGGGGGGTSYSLSIGTVTTGAPGSSASATITGSGSSQVLNLTLPAGSSGAAGASWSFSYGSIGSIIVTSGGTNPILLGYSGTWQNVGPSGATQLAYTGVYPTAVTGGGYIWQRIA